MAKKRKLRKESTPALGIGTLLGLMQLIAALLLSRSSPLSVILWLVMLLAVFVRCAMKGNSDRIMGLPGLLVVLGAFLAVRAMSMDYAETATPLIWSLPIGIGLTALLCLSVWRKEQKERAGVKALVSLLFAALIFLLSSLPVQLVNIAFDESLPRQMPATVTEKTESRAGRTASIHYVVTVAVPGEDDTPNFTVLQSAYNAISVGDEVTVTQHEGFLHSPWWELAPWWDAPPTAE